LLHSKRNQIESRDIMTNKLCGTSNSARTSSEQILPQHNKEHNPTHTPMNREAPHGNQNNELWGGCTERDYESRPPDRRSPRKAHPISLHHTFTAENRSQALLQIKDRERSSAQRSVDQKSQNQISSADQKKNF
jgi:hypothetical protein